MKGEHCDGKGRKEKKKARKMMRNEGKEMIKKRERTTWEENILDKEKQGDEYERSKNKGLSEQE